MATASASEFEQDPTGDFHLQRLRDRLSLGQCPVIEFEVFSDNELNPLLMRGGAAFRFSNDSCQMSCFCRNSRDYSGS
jgi:hypothetical protein